MFLFLTTLPFPPPSSPLPPHPSLCPPSALPWSPSQVQRSSSFAKAFRRSSKKEAERAEAEKAAALAAAAAAMAGAKVEVKRIGEKGVEVLCSNVEAGKREQVRFLP